MNRLDDSECRELLNVLWHQSMIGLALVEESGAFRSANPAFCKMVERSEAELRKLSFRDITHPADVVADLESAAEVAAGLRAAYEMHKTYITKSNRFAPAILYVTSLRTNGRFMCFVAQAMPTSPPLASEPTEAGTARRNGAMLRLVRENWALVAVACAAAGTIIAEILQKLKGGQ